jgi:hypothetical protein
MNIKRTLALAAGLLLLPMAAAADDFSAQLSGGGGAQGFASVRTGGGQIAYSIVTNGIGNITGASVAGVDLGASSANGSDAGSVASNVTDLNGAVLTVNGSQGSVSGALELVGEGGGGGPGPGGAGSIQLSADSYVALEADGKVTITVTRTGGTTGAVSIDYALVDGSAVGGEDFTAASGTIAWADGDGAAKTVAIAITDDDDAEDAEQLEVQLSNPTGGATLGTPSSATVTVFDDDSPCFEDGVTLCLSNDRFEVRATFDPPNDDDDLFEPAQAIELTGDTGYFWFFDAANVEVVVKVLNACPVNQRIWVFAGGLTNVAVEITVRDTESGAVEIYENPQSTAFQPIQDTNAFSTCP